MAQRYKLTLEYDGSGFAGWQRQQDGVTTVQGVIEAAITATTAETISTVVAGRTDAGVHAKGQVMHVDLEKDITPFRLMEALNFYTRPNPIVVLDCAIVPPSFDARFSALARSYTYQIINRRPPLALERNAAWQIVKPLDLAAMQAAAQRLLGMHDFSTFRAAGCQANSPMRTLDVAQISQQGDHFYFFFKARSFLYHQVRNMVGTLVEVGTGRWSVTKFQAALAAADRRAGGPSAPAQGLYFMGVEYPPLETLPESLPASLLAK